MAESSQSLEGPVKSYVGERTTSRRARTSQSGISRRELLKLGGKVAVVGLAALKAKDISLETNERFAKARASVGDFFDGGSEELTNQEALSIPKPRTEFDLVYPELTPQEGVSAFAQILEEEKIIGEHYLTPETYKLIAQNEQLIRKSARDAGVPEDLLLGLTIIESKGDQYAESPAGARGLTQMMPQMAEKYGLEVSEFGNDERYIPEKIVPATVKELKESYNRWGDWGLALWEWHAGAPEIYNAINMYLRDVYQEQLEDINNDSPAEVERIMKSYKDKIAQYNINVFRLFQNPLIRAEFSGPGWDLTSIYVPRAVAASIVYRANENLIASR